MRRFEDLPQAEQLKAEEAAAQLAHRVDPHSWFRMDARDRRCLAVRLRYEAQRQLERTRWLKTPEAAA